MIKYLFILIFLSGCLTTKKATDFLKDKGKLAGVCEKEYPAKETFIKGDSLVKFDTIYEGGGIDTVYTTVKDTVTRTITLPGKVVTKVVHVTDTVRNDNSYRVNSLVDKNDILTTDLTKCEADKKATEKQLDTLQHRVKGKVLIPWWWLLILALTVGGFIFLRIKKFIQPIKI